MGKKSEKEHMAVNYSIRKAAEYVIKNRSLSSRRVAESSVHHVPYENYCLLNLNTNNAQILARINNLLEGDLPKVLLSQ